MMLEGLGRVKDSRIEVVKNDRMMLERTNGGTYGRLSMKNN